VSQDFTGIYLRNKGLIFGAGSNRKRCAAEFGKIRVRCGLSCKYGNRRRAKNALLKTCQVAVGSLRPFAIGGAEAYRQIGLPNGLIIVIPRTHFPRRWAMRPTLFTSVRYARPTRPSRFPFVVPSAIVRSSPDVPGSEAWCTGHPHGPVQACPSGKYTRGIEVRTAFQPFG